MLEKFVINNFQKHKHLEIEFDQNINIISGRSDLGKSSIIRALWFLIKNQFPGEIGSIHYEWDADNEVNLQLWIDGHTITRVKGKKNNYYSLDNQKEPYRALGKDVPDDISKLLNISDANFSGQFSNVYLISNTPGQVSKELNKIIDLDCIDKTLTIASSEVKKAKSVVEVTRTRLVEAKQKKNQLIWVVEADEKLKKLEEVSVTLSRLAEKRSRIASIVENGTKTLLRKQTLLGTITKASSGITKLDELNERLVKIKDKKDKIQSGYTKYKQVKQELLGIREQLKEKHKEFEEKVGDRCPVCGKDGFSGN